MRWFLLMLVIVYPNFRSANAESGKSWERLTYQQEHMGILVKFTLYAQDTAIANKAAQQAFERIADLDRKLSDYNPESELRQLCDKTPAGQAVSVSNDLFFVLEQAQNLSQKSDGAFDVTVGPVVRLWRRARRQKSLPDAERLTAARNLVGYQKITLHKEHRAVELAQSGMRLDLGGIAKGYAGDAALTVFRKHKITRVMIDAGGDLVLGDPPPGTKGWLIGIAPLKEGEKDAVPSRVLSLQNAAVATSGDAFQHVEIHGVRYSHIVDPKTGLGLTVRSSVTVIAPTGILSDSLASAVSVLGPEKGLKLIESTKSAAGLIVVDAPLRKIASSKLSDYLVPATE